MEDVDKGLLARTHGSNLLRLVGNTPLIRLAPASIPAGVDLFAKAEWCNPTGSVKDRAAAAMVVDGIRRGLLTRQRTLIDATSGNTGISYAALGAELGFKVMLCIPSNAGEERKRLLRAYGAELVLTDPMSGTDGAQEEARGLVSDGAGRYFYPDQYSNDANWRAHYDTTAPEIWAQTNGRITHFVAGLGTTGTFVGTTRRLRELRGDVRASSVEPDSPLHGLEGLKHMETASVPKIYDAKLADERLAVSTDDAQLAVKELAKKHGLLVGTSSGAAYVASLRLAHRLTEGVVVTIFPDSATKYMRDAYWEDTD
ncbi:MAG: cysteine synthase family protein [Euryarchaeota archaeon]|nr:cysteine synthase family protein [Euryarchaeota archaeon]